MSNHLDSYLSVLETHSPEAVASVKRTVKKLIPEHIESFSHQEHITGLLLGQVQSGKTSQMLGIIAATADVDDGFSIFVLLTSDISALQQQTYRRALRSMDTFNICDEQDEMRFKEKGTRQPVIIVLKKNAKILKNWRNILASSGLCKGRPIFLVDDEADAASLNTLVNRKEQSTINKHLKDILNLSTSSFYLQVTATPQSLFLQNKESRSKPTFIHYFPPGKNYLGGDFFYTKPKPFTNKRTNDDELSTLLSDDEGIAEGLKCAIETYLITCSHLAITQDSNVCNFLVHPSIRIHDHEKIKSKVVVYLNHIFNNLKTSGIQVRLKAAWDDLKSSKPQLKSFNEVLEHLESRPEISVYTMNSGPESNSRLTFDEGLNIIIGGNSFGRGVTFKNLQTVYYCRSSKYPQADTFWQHCRMFGYDRDPLLMRVFMPEALYNLFSEINASNEILIKEIEDNRFEEIQIVTTGKIRPTRKNVVDQSKYELIVGGVNYFPPAPDQTNVEDVDKVTATYDDRPMHDITIAEAIKILEAVKSDPNNDWSVRAYINALHAIKAQKDTQDLVKLMVRRKRDIRKETGTLLSPNDRKLGADVGHLPVLTLYRLNGTTAKGWNGTPFWVPNIKFPIGKVFHRVDG